MRQYPTTAEGRQQKARANRVMFDGIAHRYDLLNRLMSVGLDRFWRRRLVNLAMLTPGMRCLDLCCGTGDVTREIARRGVEAVGLDASGEMLAIARRRGGGNVTYILGDALSAPYADESFDAVTIAFGNRNVASLEHLYSEMRRVVRSGGRVVSLEINRPASPLLQQLFFLYFSRFPALLARLLGADPSAYIYLPESVLQYLSPEVIAEIMQGAGLREIQIERHLGGIIVIHRAIR